LDHFCVASVYAPCSAQGMVGGTNHSTLTQATFLWFLQWD
jgi:hypothetical protein